MFTEGLRSFEVSSPGRGSDTIAGNLFTSVSVRDDIPDPGCHLRFDVIVVPANLRMSMPTIDI